MTDWQTPFNSPACRSRLAEERSFMRAAGRSTGFFCKSRPVLYSEAQRLAYVKTPKGASLAIQDLFQKQFSDYRWTEAHEKLPNGTVVFTFVREPLKRALSAYAEIDVAYALRATPEARNAMRTTFQHVSRKSGAKEVPRLLAFIDDLVDHRFGGDDREHWMPTHGYSQLNFICQHHVNFIGHLENQDADWDAIQGLAGIPATRRTAFPHAHDSTVFKTNASNASASPVCNRACQFKAADQHVPQTPQVLQRICDVFASDFLCLGYAMPRPCRWSRSSVAPVPGTVNGSSAVSSSGGKGGGAPVYLLRHLDEDAAWRLIREPDYRNSLFLLPTVAENRSTLYRLKRAENRSFAPQSTSGGTLLREYDRFGWQWRAVEEDDDQGKEAASSSSPPVAMEPPRAPIAIGIPTRSTLAHASPELAPDVRFGVERALAEAQQLLLLHRYDRVIVAGRGLLTDLPSTAFARHVEDRIVRLLADPEAAAGTAATPRGKNAANGSHAASSSAPHKHFLPG